MTRIDGSEQAMEIATILIYFMDLHIVIDVKS